MRNSNLLPVKAKGEVRLRSVVSRMNFGSTCTPSFITGLFPPHCRGCLLQSRRESAVSSSPRKMETTGGRRFVRAEPVIVASRGNGQPEQILIVVDRLESPHTGTAGTARSHTAFRPASSRFTPVSVANDQLLCLPLPLTPAKGFSWSRQTRPCRERDLLHDLHGQLVVVGGDVGRGVNRGKLMLRRARLRCARSLPECRASTAPRSGLP